MRAPLRSMLPLSVGVEIITRGDAATTPSRVADGAAPGAADPFGTGGALT